MDPIVTDLVLKELDEVSARDCFITCFSSEDDDIGQWRGYGDQGKGMCLHYDVTDIQRRFSPAFCGWTLYHENAEQTPFVIDVLKKFNEVITSKCSNYGISPVDLFASPQSVGIRARIRKYLTASCMMIKRREWKAEKEFRVVFVADGATAVSRKFRAKHSRVVPYLVWPEDGMEPDVLRKVTIGPVHESDMNAGAVSAMFEAYGFGGSVVRSGLSLQE